MDFISEIFGALGTIPTIIAIGICVLLFYSIFAGGKGGKGGKGSGSSGSNTPTPQ